MFLPHLNIEVTEVMKNNVGCYYDDSIVDLEDDDEDGEAMKELLAKESNQMKEKQEDKQFKQFQSMTQQFEESLLSSLHSSVIDVQLVGTRSLEKPIVSTNCKRLCWKQKIDECGIWTHALAEHGISLKP